MGFSYLVVHEGTNYVDLMEKVLLEDDSTQEDKMKEDTQDMVDNVDK